MVQKTIGQKSALGSPTSDKARVEQLEAEVRQLRKQRRQAGLEREILKKAAAYFAKESQ
jgi:transposase